MLEVITAVNSRGKSSEQNHSCYTFSKEQEALTNYSSRRSEQNDAGFALELVYRVLAFKQHLIRLKFCQEFRLLTTLFNCSVLF